MNHLARALLVAVLAVAGAAQVSCNVNDYCLNCSKDAAGSGSGSGSDAGIDGNGDATDSGTCIPTGTEICDGKDNDCNGLIDDGVLPSVGDLCANQQGECAGGVQQCVSGALTCTKKPSPEICDNKDNDCNGLTDEGDPGGGSKCGTDMGECVAGANHCVNGAIVCTGAIGGTMAPFGTAEICNAKDDDCDGLFDEGLTNMGACGVSNVGICTLGVLTCIGGAPACDADPNMAGVQPPVTPQFEACDGLDNDCDGSVDEDYNLMTDPQHCGACATVCGANLTNGGNATWGCTAGGCVIASCKAGYHDNNNSAADGCEFGPCFNSGAEVCDGVDNNCNGQIDEGVTPPAGLCNQTGQCAGSTASCQGSAGFVCSYGPTVSQQGHCSVTTATVCTADTNCPTGETCVGKVIVAETKCDGLDNDCNGIIDDHQPQMAHNDGTTLTPVTCDDGKLGVCKGTGAYACDASNLTGPAVCVITAPGGTMTTESCNNKDDDCDGVIDNGASTGNLIGQNWINIGGGHQMMQFEASKPDATGTDMGSVNTITCSKSGVQPWTNVKYPDAQAACAAVGARLCTEQEWHRACSVVAPTVYPVSVPAGAFTTTIEAENYFSIAANTDTTVTPNETHQWVEDYTPGFSSISDMEATPITGSNISAANAPAMSPRMDYQFNFAAAGNYRVCLRAFAPSANTNTAWVGINASLPGTASATSLAVSVANTWQWIGPSASIAVTAGTRYVSVYMGKDGLRVDQVFLTSGTTCPGSTTTTGPGGTWSYATNPTVYNGTTCNGADYSALNDNVLATGSLASCYAAISATDHPFDLSGNVKEWTQAHSPGENPIRGGASNNTGPGISCPLNFTLGDDTFFFPNVGFRCCR